MVDSLEQRWHGFWFGAASPFNLAICRIFLFAGAFLFYAPQDFSLWAEVSSVFWMPLPLFKALNVPLFSAPTLNILQIVWKALLLLICLGLFTRLSTLLAFVLGFYLLGVPQNFGKVSHGDMLLIFTLGIMATAYCGDALALDQYLPWQKTSQASIAQRAASGEYTWPIRLVWVLMALIFLGAATSKLRDSGLLWATSDNLRIILIQHQYLQLPSWRAGALALANIPWLPHLLAAGTLLLELSFPLALVSSWARRIIVPSVGLMQVGIAIFMGMPFVLFLLCYLFWIPWERLWLAMRSLYYPLAAPEPG